MNYNHLYYFHVVAELGSLSAAARELGVTLPTVSEQIKQFEASMGYRLFDRTGRGLRLTEAGRLAQQHTSVMFRESQRLLDRLDTQTNPDRHILEVGVASTVSRAFAADYFLPLFKFEDVFVRMQTGEENHLLQELMMHEIDLLVTDQAIHDPSDRGLACELIDRPTMVAIGAGAVADKVKEFPADLDKVPIVHHTKSSKARWQIDLFFRDAGIHPVVLGEVTDIGIMRALANGGVAVAILPRVAVDRRDEARILGELTGIRSDVLVVFNAESPSDVIQRAVTTLKRGRDDAPEASAGEEPA